MEVLLRCCRGVPEGSLLSVRAAHSRRQAPVQPERALPFPLEAFACAELQVDLLVVLGRACLALQSATNRYTVEFDSPSSDEVISCELEVHRGFGCAEMHAGNDCSEKAPHPAAGGGHLPRRHAAALSAQKYMETHGLVQAVQAAMETTMSKWSEDPITFLVDCLLAYTPPAVSGEAPSPTAVSAPSPPPAEVAAAALATAGDLAEDEDAAAAAAAAGGGSDGFLMESAVRMLPKRRPRGGGVGGLRRGCRVWDPYHAASGQQRHRWRWQLCWQRGRCRPRCAGTNSAATAAAALVVR